MTREGSFRGPRRLGRYQLLGELGRGGMGVVYRAFDPHLDREVAVKKLLGLEAADLPRFEREGRVLARLRHAAIASVHDVVSEGPGAPYLVMDLVAGETLSALLRRGPLDDRRVAAILVEVADAVAHAHRRGVLHRDLKPQNIRITPEGRPVVLDFGLAKDYGRSSITASGEQFGTPEYMAPEQAESSRDYRGAPADGGPWRGGTEDRRLRGGSFDFPANRCSATVRAGGFTDDHVVNRGFRVVFDLPEGWEAEEGE